MNTNGRPSLGQAARAGVLPAAAGGPCLGVARAPKRMPHSLEPVGGTGDGLDLAALLASRGLAHWNHVLATLFARYAGWLTDYWLDSRFDLDIWPEADVISALVAMPPATRGDDLGFGLALYGCDFLARHARDEITGEVWDPLLQPYGDFQTLRRAEPFWGSQPPWPVEVLLAWALKLIAEPPG